MKITVKIEASETTGSRTFDLGDLGFTEKEWELLDDEEKNKAVEKAVFDLHEQPYWTLTSFNEK